MPSFRKPAQLAMLSLLLIASLPACSTLSKPIPTAATAAPTSAATPQVCLVWKIVRYSKDDTALTIEQARQNNAAQRAICHD